MGEGFKVWFSAWLIAFALVASVVADNSVVLACAGSYPLCAYDHR
jgi:hypothetical protein